MILNSSLSTLSRHIFALPGYSPPPPYEFSEVDFLSGQKYHVHEQIHYVSRIHVMCMFSEVSKIKIREAANQQTQNILMI